MGLLIFYFVGRSVESLGTAGIKKWDDVQILQFHHKSTAVLSS